MSLPPISFATDTELRDAAYAEKLQRRRKMLLRMSLPIIIVGALLALKLLSAVGLNLIGTSAYDRANYSTAAARYVNTQLANIVQPWKAYYNEGTAHYSAGKFFTATQRLEIALEKVPKAPEGEPRGPQECAVRVNYSLALEGIGDESLALGDPATAERYYTDALEMLADCANAEGEDGETAEEAQDRQEDSLEEAQSQQEPDEGDGGGGGTDEDDGEGGGGGADQDDGDEDDSATEDDTGGQDPKEQELEDRNQQANEEDSGGDDGEFGPGDGSGQNW